MPKRESTATGQAGDTPARHAEVDVASWCLQRCGSPVVQVLMETGLQSQVVAVLLDDGRQVVVKVRPWHDRLVACAQVQQELGGAGYPCPDLLDGPVRRGVQAWSIEAYRPGGRALTDGPTGAPVSASLLADLVAATTRTQAAGLAQALAGTSMPWVGWDHTGERLWAEPDTFRVPLNDHPGPTWIDQTAAAARQVLQAHATSSGWLVVGHGDWGRHNLRAAADLPAAVYDWDSVVAQPEAAVVGSAAAVWAADQHTRHAATVTESAAFVRAYQRSSGRRWSQAEVALAWAAGLWTRCYNAKKAAVTGGGLQLNLLTAEIDQYRRHARL